MANKVDPAVEKLIVDLASGLGPLSPSGKSRWTPREIGMHPSVQRSKASIYEFLQRRKHLLPQENEPTRENRQAAIYDKKIARVDEILDAMGKKDLSKSSLKDLGITLKNINDTLKQEEKKELNVIVIGDTLRQLEKINMPIIDVEDKNDN